MAMWLKDARRYIMKCQLAFLTATDVIKQKRIVYIVLNWGGGGKTTDMSKCANCTEGNF